MVKIRNFGRSKAAWNHTMPLYKGIEAGGTTVICVLGTGPNGLRPMVQFPTTTPQKTLGTSSPFCVSRDHSQRWRSARPDQWVSTLLGEATARSLQSWSQAGRRPMSWARGSRRRTFPSPSLPIFMLPHLASVVAAQHACGYVTSISR